MIRLLKIINIQSNKKTILKFSKGLNIIVGPTDSGKSAIFRALRVAIWNRPPMNSMKSLWGGNSLVKIKNEDHIVIRRDKSYTLDDLKPFKAFGQSVPEEITKALNFADINLKVQKDDHFLIGNTSGEVAKHFNKIANLSAIDSSQANVKKWMQQIESSIASKQDDLKSKEEEIEQYADLDKIESEIEALEVIENKISSINKKEKNITKLIEQISKIEDDIAYNEEFISIEPEVDKLISLIKKKDKLDIKIDTLSELLDDIKSTENEVKKYAVYIESEKLINELISLYNSVKKIESEQNELQNLISKIKKCDNDLNNAESSYNALHRRFDKMMGDTCILCGTKLK